MVEEVLYCVLDVVYKFVRCMVNVIGLIVVIDVSLKVIPVLYFGLYFGRFFCWSPSIMCNFYNDGEMVTSHGVWENLPRRMVR